MTTYPISQAVLKTEGHVIVENHEDGVYEDFDSVAEYVAFYAAKMKAMGSSHQAISGFKRKWRAKP